MLSTSYPELPKKPVGAKRICVISDVHLGHRRTPTAHILENLYRHVINPDTFNSIDGLLITGDLFDRLLNLPATNDGEIHEFVLRTLKLAKLFNVAIRILEGTDSHDWHQSEIFVRLNAASGIDADLQYHDSIAIVDDESLGITIGYIPDNYRETTEQTTKEFRELMAARAYSQLDIMAMHGFFEFQAPPNDSNSFDSTYFNSITKYNIFIGHDHVAKTRGKIIIPSSFDKTKFDEYGFHGFVISDIVEGKIYNHRIANENAMVYEMLEITDLSDEDAIKAINSQLQTQRSGYLKIRLNSASGLRGLVNEWKRTPLINVEVEFISDKELLATINEAFKLSSSMVNISASNVAGLILRELSEIERVDTEAVTREIETILANV